MYYLKLLLMKAKMFGSIIVVTRDSLTVQSGTPLIRPPLGHKILVVITRWSH